METKCMKKYKLGQFAKLGNFFVKIKKANTKKNPCAQCNMMVYNFHYMCKYCMLQTPSTGYPKLVLQEDKLYHIQIDYTNNINIIKHLAILLSFMTYRPSNTIEKDFRNQKIYCHGEHVLDVLEIIKHFGIYVTGIKQAKL